MENQELRQISEEELNEVLEQHKLWLETRFAEEVKGQRANLSGVDLSNADLSDTNLRCANLRDTDLSNANLSGADFNNANLGDTNLRCANLSCADLSDVNLSGADISNANLCYTNLRCANLGSADFSNAELSDTNLCYAYLSNADLRNANLDFSCFPLWCGGLDVNIDDKQAIQLLYHLVRNVQYSNNTSKSLKELLLQPQIVAKANEFHRVGECGEIKTEAEQTV